jgi:hypothetical protein
MGTGDHQCLCPMPSDALFPSADDGKNVAWPIHIQNGLS